MSSNQNFQCRPRRARLRRPDGTAGPERLLLFQATCPRAADTTASTGSPDARDRKRRPPEGPQTDTEAVADVSSDQRFHHHDRHGRRRPGTQAERAEGLCRASAAIRSGASPTCSCAIRGCGRRSGTSIPRSRTRTASTPATPCTWHSSSDGRTALQVRAQRPMLPSQQRLRPLLRSSPLDTPIATIPYGVIAAFLARPGRADARADRHGALRRGIARRARHRRHRPRTVRQEARRADLGARY